MKKITLLLLWLTSFYISAQLPVSQTPENKNVVLEEFTGIHCPYCPDGHRIAQQIQDAHPDDVFLINIHTGGYAVPNSGEPDFRTQFGGAIANEANVPFYPSGSVNRHLFSGTATATSRSDWNNNTNTILGQSAYCNVALEASVDINTREMVVNVEVYYTANGSSENYINVALLQDNVEGPQAGANAFNPAQVLPNGNYNHMHILRHLITGQWGDQVTTTSQGTLVQRQYTYTLPQDINGVPLELGNLQVVAFVAEGHQEIITGNDGPISYTGFQYANNLKVTSLSGKDTICSPNDLKPMIELQNYGSNTINGIDINYDINGISNTVTYNNPVDPLQKVQVDLPDLSFNVNANNTLNATVSIQGQTDEDPSDNSADFPFYKTQNIGNGTDYTVTIVQDQWGSETQWAILDENQNILANGGPYSDLSGSGTQTHTHNVTLNSDGCYQFVILDAYGDGMCCTYGSGNYAMSETSTGNIVFYGDGQFTTKATKLFEIQNTNAIDNDDFTAVSIYPNPTSGYIQISNAKDLNLNIYEINGKQIYHSKLSSNHEKIDLSHLANGMYLVKIYFKDKVDTRKLIINK